jgi:hypothetical protein
MADKAQIAIVIIDWFQSADELTGYLPCCTKKDKSLDWCCMKVTRTITTFILNTDKHTELQLG